VEVIPEEEGGKPLDLVGSDGRLAAGDLFLQVGNVLGQLIALHLEADKTFLEVRILGLHQALFHKAEEPDNGRIGVLVGLGHPAEPVLVLICLGGERTDLKVKPEVMDPTILERIKKETIDYLKTYIPFGAGGCTIGRTQTTVVHEMLSELEGPTIVLLTGVAGSGKSGVVRGVIDKLEQRGIPALALRVDQHLACRTSKELGIALIGRAESPAWTLARLAPGRMSVLVIDQVDAISEVSGRNGAVRESVLRLLDEAHNLKIVRVLLVCRTLISIMMPGSRLGSRRRR